MWIINNNNCLRKIPWRKILKIWRKKNRRQNKQRWKKKGQKPIPFCPEVNNFSANIIYLLISRKKRNVFLNENEKKFVDLLKNAWTFSKSLNQKAHFQFHLHFFSTHSFHLFRFYLIFRFIYLTYQHTAPNIIQYAIPFHTPTDYLHFVFVMFLIN